jgi:hypothetical protein
VSALPEAAAAAPGAAAWKHNSARLLGAAVIAASALALFGAPAAMAQTGAAPIAEVASVAAISAGDTAWVLTSTALVGACCCCCCCC